MRCNFETNPKYHFVEGVDRALVYPFHELTGIQVKRRIMWEQKFLCAICSCTPFHNGQPLVFQLDHIDGNNRNDDRINLRMICPNCHSQTKTFAGRNR